MKSEEVSWEREIFLTEKGYLVRLEMKSIRFSKPFCPEFPEGYKFRWIIYNIDNPEQSVRVDNHYGKSLHFHIDNEQPGQFLSWVSLEDLRQFFFQKAYTHFGYFNYE
jgi:hypothetical protein